MWAVKHHYVIVILLGLLFNSPKNAFSAPAQLNPPTSADTSFLENTETTPGLDSLNDNTIIPDEEDIELILQTKVKRLILGDAFGIQKKNITYIGMQNLFNLLDFPIDINTKQKSASGWFIKEDNHFFMEETDDIVEAIEISSKGSNFSVDQNKFLFREDDIYVEANTLFETLEIKHEINTNTLTLVLLPSEPLPVQEKLARKKRKKAKFKNLKATLPQKHTPYKRWSMPFIDVQTRYTETSLGYNTSTYSILAAGDLAYMTGTYYLQGDDTDNLRYFRIKLSRDSLSNNLLGPLKATHFSFGEINPNVGGGVGSASQEIGARISNKPFGRNIRLQQTDFIGDTQPDWDVELYRNNLFLGGQTVGDSGRYEFFNQGILPGKNVFKLIFYGPEGQQYEKIEEINIEQSGVATGQTFYDISLSKQYSSIFELRDNIPADKRNNKRLNLSLFRDINEYISLQTTYSRYTFLDGTTHNFVKPAIRVFALNTLFFSNVTKDLNGGYLAYYSLSKSFWKQALSYSKQKQSENYYIESSDIPSPAQDTQSLSLSGPLMKTHLLKLDYGLDASKRIVTDQVSDTYKANFSATAFKLTMANNFTYAESKKGSNKTNKTLTGNSNLNRSIYRFNLRAGADYLLTPASEVKNIKLKQLTKLFGNISWLTFSKLRMQYGYNYLPQTGITAHSFRFNLRTKKFSLTADYTRNSNDTYTMYAGINFSLGYDKSTSSLKISSDRIARTGAISAKVFIDDNNNGIHDHDEPVIKDARVNMEQARKIGKTNKKGVVFLPGLPVNVQTDVQLDTDSLKDPFLTPAEQGYSFIPRPGVIETLHVPLLTSGEIEGIISIENENGSTQTVGYAPLVLTNIKTREKREIISAYDGFYLFSNVPPGKYLVAIDRSYLTRYEYGARKPMPRVVTIYPTGNVDMGNDFAIYPLPKK